MKKRIGLIGLGDIAQKVYVPLLAQHEAVEIAGIMSTTAATVERILHQYRLPYGTTELDALLRKQLDAVFVHAPTEAHYEIIKKCLAANVPVYVDKPLTADWKQSVELAGLAEQKGLLLAVGFNRRFAPHYQAARLWLEQVGGFEWASVQKHRSRLQPQPARYTLYDDLIHMLDLLLWLGQGEHRLAAHAINSNEAGQLLCASGTLSFSAATATFSMARQAGVDLEKVELHGHGRSAEVTNLESAMFYEQKTPPHSCSFASWDTILHRRGFAGVVEHFLQNAQTPETCTIRADLVLGAHALVEKLL